jgi:lipoic acid synthetase
LIPDFKGNIQALRAVLAARPDVLNHNIETVASLHALIRPQASYQRSLALLERAKKEAPAIAVKSGLMLGLGESAPEIRRTLEDLLHAGCEMLTLGQYLQPSALHLKVERYVPPEEFEDWKQVALDMGFSQVASGPFVRSSYHAENLFRIGKVHHFSESPL